MACRLAFSLRADENVTGTDLGEEQKSVRAHLLFLLNIPDLSLGQRAGAACLQKTTLVVAWLPVLSDGEEFLPPIVSLACRDEGPFEFLGSSVFEGCFVTCPSRSSGRVCPLCL